ncbi:MAG TPA: protein translocase subunit SecF [Ilumatobacteraceae bacterium]|nr:protein translocase subunit SecF [Ilumatobacteraceae bacterium]
MSAETLTAVRPRRGLGGRLYHGETAIDFYGRRWWGLIGSALLLVVTVISLIFSGLNLGLDFKGGVAWEVPSQNLSAEAARGVLDANGVGSTNAKVQERTSASGSVLVLQVGDQSVEKRQQVQEALAAAAQVDADQVSVTSVSSTWGRSITEKAVRALIIFLILVAAFIAWRLEWRMALAAIIAMIHDVLISVGVYSLFGFEVTPATVVAFLTILGFSLYDTIVVFDKVKENTKHYATMRLPYADVINVSMNQVLMRSINTSIAAVLPVLSLLVLGAEILGAVTLREFALAMLVGLVTGSYSSIFIASPLLAMIKEREPRFRTMRGPHATGPELERLVLGGSPAARREAARLRAEAGEAQVVLPSAQKPTQAFSHPPRPRKKKRRTS